MEMGVAHAQSREGVLKKEPKQRAEDWRTPIARFDYQIHYSNSSEHEVKLTEQSRQGKEVSFLYPLLFLI